MPTNYKPPFLTICCLLRIRIRTRRPKLNDIDCSQCVLGFEPGEETNVTSGGGVGRVTCLQPEFRPYTGWDGGKDQGALLLQVRASRSALSCAINGKWI